jgi:hypothetical protein
LSARAALRDPGLGVLAAALVLFLALLFSHDARLTSDGIDHYVYLRSAFVDHDLDLANDYALVAPSGVSDAGETPLGLTGNAHPVGPAVVWAPFYAAAELVTRLRGRTSDGLDRLHLDAVAVGSVLYGWLGLVLLYFTARREASAAAALLATLAVGFGTFLYFYVAFAPTMAHAPAFGAAALFVWLWLRPPHEGVRRAALLGAACGLLALLRWANVLIAVLPFVEALPRLRRREQWLPLVREAGAFAALFSLAFWPQMFTWWVLYGSPLTIPQGASFIAGSPAWDGVLFSPRHGLFSWSPILYLGAAGLVVGWRRQPLRLAAVLLFALALVRINAGVADWWAGAAFGGRRFDALLPLFGLGLAFAADALAALVRRRPLVPVAALFAAAVLWNALLARQFKSGGWDYSGPIAFEDMGRSVVGQIDRAIGSPFSLPSSLWAWARGGPAPADYESSYMERRHNRWSIRMGEDDRIFLEDGWGAARTEGGASYRLLEAGSAGLVVPLHESRPYEVGARLRVLGSPSARVRVLLNDRVVGLWDVTPGFEDFTLATAADVVRPGRNALRFKRPGDGPWEGEIAVAGVWMDPKAR